MSDAQEWTYYRYGLESEDDNLYYRYDGGEAQLFSTGRGEWVPIDGNYLSRYIELGEIMLNEVTREQIERELGVPLPA